MREMTAALTAMINSQMSSERRGRTGPLANRAHHNQAE